MRRILSRYYRHAAHLFGSITLVLRAALATSETIFASNQCTIDTQQQEAHIAANFDTHRPSNGRPRHLERACAKIEKQATYAYPVWLDWLTALRAFLCNLYTPSQG